MGDVRVGAIVAVSALGDIYDWKNGDVVAGLLDESKTRLRSSTDEMYKKYDVVENKFAGNTTLGIIITNAKFDKAKLNKIAGMAHNGYARTIRPVHTSADGDSIFAMSVGEIAADMDMVGTLAADVMAEADLRAVRTAESEYGYISAKKLLADNVLVRKLVGIETAGNINVLFTDLDNFKTVNDSDGHGEGDELLKAFARLLESIAEDSFPIRLG